jgi:hypothetical protein
MKIRVLTLPQEKEASLAQRSDFPPRNGGRNHLLISR